MFTKISTVSLYVADQQRAKKFYTEKLGFELRTDAELYPGATSRWIAVAPKGAETELILYAIDDHWKHYEQVIGKAQSVTLQVTDIQAVYDDLKAKGVEFTDEPSKEPWGTYATMLDSEGNQILLTEYQAGQ